MLAKPGVLLRLEGAAFLAAVVYLYRVNGGSWWLFLALFLWPDLGMLGYLANVRLGARLYNLVHIAAIPVLMAVWSYATHQGGLLSFALIWLAHIEWDRAFGYGLKYPTFFKDTHLQHVGDTPVHHAAISASS
jgi:hypothetical protein